jgi:hypothetical protein
MLSRSSLLHSSTIIDGAEHNYRAYILIGKTSNVNCSLARVPSFDRTSKVEMLTLS